MKVSNCCGALFVKPGWPDNDLCSACMEHADVVEQDEPSIKVIEMPTLTNVMEDKIKLLMVMEGYDRHRISFRGDSRRYMVYKYWEPINNHSLEYVSTHTNAVFNVEELYDDDCGWLYSYNILYKS